MSNIPVNPTDPPFEHKGDPKPTTPTNPARPNPPTPGPYPRTEPAKNPDQRPNHEKK